MRVEAAIQPIACGKSERQNGANLLPAAVTIARESNVASDIPRLSCICKLRSYRSTLSPAKYIRAARAALCKAIDMPSPVNEGITAA